MTEPRVPPPAGRDPSYGLLALAGLLAGLVVVVVILLVTGGDETVPATGPATTPTAAAARSTAAATTAAVATTATAATETPPSQFAGDTGPEVAGGDPFADFAFLTDVGIQQHQGFTRVVLGFEGDTVPWWSVEYAAGPFVSAADEAIPVGGTAFLRVVLASTSFDLSGSEVRITYDGPERIAANTGSAVEIVRTDDFEGSSTWIVGVMGIKPFAVGTGTEPARVHIDIAD